MCTKLKESLIILWKIIKDKVRKKKSVNNKGVNNKSACKFDGSCYNSTVIFFRPVGQEVKTPPSQGGITGSIPVQAACRGAEKKSLISRDALAVANASLFLYVNL